MKIDNPADRLIHFLEECLNFPTPQNVSSVNALSNILGLSNDEGRDVLFARIGEVIQLPGKTHKIIQENFPANSHYSSEWLHLVNKSFSSLHLAGTFDSFTTSIDRIALRELKLVSMIIATKGAVEHINVAKLNEWKETLSLLKQEVHSCTDYSLELQDCLVKYINKLIFAIDGYQINGNESLLDAMEAATGHLLLDPEYRNVVMNEQEGPGQKFREILSAVADATSITTDAILPMIATGINFFLTYKP